VGGNHEPELNRQGRQDRQEDAEHFRSDPSWCLCDSEVRNPASGTEKAGEGLGRESRAGVVQVRAVNRSCHRSDCRRGKGLARERDRGTKGPRERGSGHGETKAEVRYQKAEFRSPGNLRNLRHLRMSCTGSADLASVAATRSKMMKDGKSRQSSISGQRATSSGVGRGS